jgi:ribosome maturation factor RimP
MTSNLQGRFKGTSKGSRVATPRAGRTVSAAVVAPRPLSGSDGRTTIERTVAGLGYELVEIERAGRGLLRVTIDRRPGQVYASGDGEFVLVQDCEQVTRQLQFALEVEGVDYARLEVSSPGLDRPLKSEADLTRFSGQAVSLTLKLPFQGRKHYQGQLGGEPGAWTLTFGEPKATPQQLGFTFDEVREARLVPVLNFKGRAKTTAPAEQGESEE